MEMHQIRYFLAVCETLNFTRAAEACHVTQPALSRAVQQLEAEVGGLLFRRERSQTHVTDLGRLMKPHLEEILSQADAARVRARSFLTLESATLNVGVMCTIGPVRFMSFLAMFRQQNPGIELSLIEGVPTRLTDLLAEGQLDVAFMAQAEPFNERFDVRPIYRERFAVAFAAGHRYAAMDTVPAAELDGEAYLSRINCEFRDRLREACQTRGATVQIVYRSEREDWIQSMVAAGLGICCLPEYAVVMPGVASRPMVDPEVVRDISLVTLAGRRFSPAVQRFVESVRGYNWPEADPH